MGVVKLNKVERISREEKIGLLYDLINAFKIVRKPVETALFLQDLLTANEIKNLALRLRIAKLLLKGETQRDVASKAKVSLATVNKVNIWLNQGGKGFRDVVRKLPAKWKIPKKAKGIPIEFHGPQILAKVIQYSVSKKQDKKVEDFIDGVESKKLMGKKLREAYKDQFRK